MGTVCSVAAYRQSLTSAAQLQCIAEMRLIAADVARSVVCVSLSVLGTLTERVLDWCHLVNTIERYAHCSDTALCQINSTACLHTDNTDTAFSNNLYD